MKQIVTIKLRMSRNLTMFNKGMFLQQFHVTSIPYQQRVGYKVNLKTDDG